MCPPNQLGSSLQPKGEQEAEHGRQDLRLNTLREKKESRGMYICRKSSTCALKTRAFHANYLQRDGQNA